MPKFKVNPNTIAGVLYGLNWQGHVELSDVDIRWLAREIANAITQNRQGRCDNCDNQHAILVRVSIGNICEDCVESIGRMTDEIREEYEQR